MSFDLIPKNKSAQPMHIGGILWHFMLNEGLGLVLGTGKGSKPAQFIYITRPDGLCVQYNDGARVTAKECRELAKTARRIVDLQEARLRQWEEVPDEEKSIIERNEMQIYDPPWSPQTIKKFSDFAEWCDKAGGFRIW